MLSKDRDSVVNNRLMAISTGSGDVVGGLEDRRKVIEPLLGDGGGGGGGHKKSKHEKHRSK